MQRIHRRRGLLQGANTDHRRRRTPAHPPPKRQPHDEPIEGDHVRDFGSRRFARFEQQRRGVLPFGRRDRGSERVSLKYCRRSSSWRRSRRSPHSSMKPEASMLRSVPQKFPGISPSNPPRICTSRTSAQPCRSPPASARSTWKTSGFRGRCASTSSRWPRHGAENSIELILVSIMRLEIGEAHPRGFAVREFAVRRPWSSSKREPASREPRSSPGLTQGLRPAFEVGHYGHWRGARAAARPSLS